MTFLSHKKQFIFFHIYKNAGTSIKSSLRKVLKNDLDLIPFCGIRSIDKFSVRFLRKIAEKNIYLPCSTLQYKYYRSYSHLSYLNFEDQFEKISEYKTFAIVRNPYSWQFSLYKFMKNNSRLPNHHLVKNMNFEEYIKWRCLKENLNTQRSVLISSENKIKISKIIKIEDLNKEWESILEWLDIPFTKLSYKNKSSSDINEYKHFYNEESISYINKYFKEDFVNFNYDQDV